MGSSRRSLTFTVGTSLLTASLATSVVGCGKKEAADVHPDEVAQPTVNEGMAPDPSEPEAEPTEPEPPSDDIVNEAPVDG